MVMSQVFTNRRRGIRFSLMQPLLPSAVRYLFKMILMMLGKQLGEILDKEKPQCVFMIQASLWSILLLFGNSVALDLQKRPFRRTVAWTERATEHDSTKEQVIFCQAHCRYPAMAPFCNGREKQRRSLTLLLLRVPLPPTLLSLPSPTSAFQVITVLSGAVHLGTHYTGSKMPRKEATVPVGNVILCCYQEHII